MINPKPSILLIDDSKLILTIASAVLSDHCKVRVAPDGETGLAAAQRFMPDLILLDLEMPGLSGSEVCRQLKVRMPTAAIPVVLMSAASAHEGSQQALDLGAAGFIPKPFTAESLWQQVRLHLEV